MKKQTKQEDLVSVAVHAETSHYKLTLIGSGVIALALLFALPAYAQTITGGDVGAGASGNAGGIQVGADVSAEVRAQTGGDEQEDDNVEEGEARVSGGETEQDNTVSVNAREIRNMSAEQRVEFLTTVKTHAQVQSGEDLENFATGILLQDENVQELSADEEGVEVRYRVPAKLFGFFETTLPVTVTAKAKAESESDGRVQVRYPWFSFLFSVPEEVSETAIESDVRAAVSGDLDSDDDGVLDASLTARLYASISAVLKARHDAAMNAIGNVR